jgi:DNA-binding response OmpR family regulator
VEQIGKMRKKMEKRIMVVDDDPDILIAIRKIFENEGFEVFTVDSGMDCLKELERGFRGIILMDIMMPFMDGWDTINEIMRKGYSKNVIISILTAKGTPDYEKMRGLESYIHYYITKPFDVRKLITDIRQMVAM